MESAKYEEVNGILSEFDPFDVFEIGKHVKPEFVSETFTFKNAEFTVEIPFGMLEVVFGNVSKDEVPKSVTTPKGTEAYWRTPSSSHLVLRTRFLVDGVVWFAHIDMSKKDMTFFVFEDKPGDRDFTVDEHLVGFSLSEPRIAQIRFRYYEGDDDVLFEGDGKGSIIIANFTKEGFSKTGPCDISSMKEASEVANQFFAYRLFRRIAHHF